MKKVTIILTGVILMALNAINVNAQSNSTATASSTARIIEHITLTYEDQPLAFGSIIKDPDGGTVTVAAATGAVSYIGLPTQLSTTTSAALFKVVGEAGYNFSITLPGNEDIELEGPSSSDLMSVVDFNSTLDDEGNNLIPSGGEITFQVGATLLVGENQTSGVYSGTFPVTVTYE